MTTTGSTMPSFDDTQFLPLDTDAAIEERVRDLIGRANQRQLWLLFLDEYDLQLPLLVPINGLPASPTAVELDALVESVVYVMEGIGATSIVVVLERYGPAAFTSQDIEWARALQRACAGSGVALRAQLLSHRSGVRWIAADDLV